MELYWEVIKLLLTSLFANDVFMFAFAFLTILALVFTLKSKKNVKDEIENIKLNGNVSFSKHLYNEISTRYTIFTTMITIFPLLGMLGTVCGLLGLDLANGDMDNIKNNFFIALTSTAWGIVFASLFKIINAFISDGVEEQIENAKKFTEGYYFKGGFR